MHTLYSVLVERSIKQCLIQTYKGYKGYRKEAFSQEVRLLACS